MSPQEIPCSNACPFSTSISTTTQALSRPGRSNEFENWRRIRDWEGAEGWVYHSLLAGKRSAVVVPTLKDDLVPLFEKADAVSAVAARLQSGVLGQLKSCNGLWCEFSGKGFSGWIKQERLWGAYPNEKVD